MESCRYCGNIRSLVKAHVIPESFFRRERADEPTLLMVSGAEGTLPKRSPIGAYDRHLLCSDCERKFEDLDGYAAKVLLNDFDALFTPLVDHGNTIAFESTRVDQAKLLRFFVSLAWRASVSEEPFFSRVALGPHEQAAKDVIEHPDRPVPTVFGALLSRWQDASLLGTKGHGVMDPFAEKWEGVNAYRFSLGQTTAYLKVDRRPFPEPFPSLTLCSGDALRVMGRDFSASSEFKAMVSTVKRSDENASKFRTLASLTQTVGPPRAPR